MIPHRQEYPLRTTVCPLLADRRHARPERALLPGRSSKPCTHKQDARDTVKWLTMPDHGCAWWSIDHDRGARAALAQAKKFNFSFLSFCFLHLVVVASSLLALSSGSLLLSGRMAVTYRCAPALEPFFTGSRSEEEGAEAHGPEDRPSRRRVVLLSFFSPGSACNSSWRHSPSHAKPCWLVQYTRNPQQTGRKQKWSRTHRAAVHRLQTRWSRFWFWERIFS